MTIKTRRSVRELVEFKSEETSVTLLRKKLNGLLKEEAEVADLQQAVKLLRALLR